MSENKKTDIKDILQSMALQKVSERLLTDIELLNKLTGGQYVELCNIMNLTTVSIVSKDQQGGEKLCNDENIDNNFKISREAFLLKLKQVNNEANNLTEDMNKVSEQVDKEKEII